MVTRIIIDTNIFVSAIGWKGTPRKAIEKAIDFSCELIVPYEQIDELSKVLRYSSLNFSVEEKIRVYKIISELDRIVAVIPKRKTRRGAVDDILLDAAEQFDVQYVVTGDEGLLAQHYAGNAKIVTPEAFLQSEC